MRLLQSRLPWRSAVAVGLLLGAALAAGPVAAAGPLTLDDYYAAALRRSEVIATQSELIRQAEERTRQANAALLPIVSGFASYTWLDELPPGVSATPSTLDRQKLARLTATQPLFRGFREFAAIRQSKALLGAQADDDRHARRLLFTDVVVNFYTVLALESDLRNFEEEIRLNEERLRDIQARIRIGRSRVSEALNVETTVSTLRAQVEQLRGQLQVAREALAFLSGLDAATPLTDTEPLPERLAPLDGFLAGIAARPDVQAAAKRLDAARENVSVVRGEHLPSLDLNGNYYLERPGYLDDITWDVELALTVPIYAGGSIQSRVREAASQHTQAELARSQVTRLAEQEVRALHQSVQYDLVQLAALEKSTEAARRSYEAQSREYRLGLVINLDVLQALAAYQQNRRALDRARLALKADHQRLLAAAARRNGLPAGAGP